MNRGVSDKLRVEMWQPVHGTEGTWRTSQIVRRYKEDVNNSIRRQENGKSRG